MVKNAKANLSEVKNILADAGYTGENFATQIKATIGATVEVIKRSELHTFAVLPKRWVVERSFAWLEKCRRLWKNCERKLNTSLQICFHCFAPQKIMNRFLESQESALYLMLRLCADYQLLSTYLIRVQQYCLF